MPPYRECNERPVRLRDAHGLALPAVEFAAPPPAVQARGLQPLTAEERLADGGEERRLDDVRERDGPWLEHEPDSPLGR